MIKQQGNIFKRRRQLARERWRERGDTLVEVLLAITILSIVAVGAMAVMNRGNALVQSSLERTSIRGEINSQIEMLNYARDNSGEQLWGTITSRTVSVDRAKDNCEVTNDKSFYLSFDNIVATPPSISNLQMSGGVPIAQSSGRATAGNGLWIDVVSYPRSDTNQVGYFDFYIKACWTPIGEGSGTRSTSLTIVRMYDDN